MTPRRLLVVPTGSGVGLTSVCLGVVRALDRLGVPFAFCRPVSVRAGPDHSGDLLARTAHLSPPAPITREHALALLGRGDDDELLEEVVALVEGVSEGASVVVIEGVVPVPELAFATRLNVAMAKALDAELVLVGAARDADPAAVAHTFDIAARAYGEVSGGQLRSCILNKVHVPNVTLAPGAVLGGARLIDDATRRPFEVGLAKQGLHLLGFIPKLSALSQPRVSDVTTALGATVLHAGDSDRRVARVAIAAATARYASHTLTAGTLVVTPADRDDVLMAVALATLGGTHLAGVVLTCAATPSPEILALCQPALDTGLPLVSTDTETYPTATAIHDLKVALGADDAPLAELAMNVVANHLDGPWLADLAATARTQRMTTPAFRHRLISRARAANQRVVLPEGDEPRTLAAAAICARRGIAQCLLLGDPVTVRRTAKRHGVDLPDTIEVLSPADLVDKYVGPMVTLRGHKGLTTTQAADALHDPVILGTMMLATGDVDGLVSGAVHSTAHTIRPALQLVRTAPGASLVSSVFFMCLPDQVLVYGDCAVNPNPTAEQLAEIAIQSADSAAAFGIPPRVAMISYSTGSSGAGADVEKVSRATALARAARPDLLIDGPLQYDAAAIESVGHLKAPDSAVAGRATVFVFPDLNTGNTTYKAVQRSAGVVSMGPMLQGLAKPVNDLSRGALVEDIVFTVALTAIQAQALADRT